VLAFVERHVGDFAEAGAVVDHRADMATINFIRAVAEVVGAFGGQPREHRINFCLGGDEGVQRGIIRLGRGGSRVGFGDMTA